MKVFHFVQIEVFTISCPVSELLNKASKIFKIYLAEFCFLTVHRHTHRSALSQMKMWKVEGLGAQSCPTLQPHEL